MELATNGLGMSHMVGRFPSPRSGSKTISALRFSHERFQDHFGPFDGSNFFPTCFVLKLILFSVSHISSI
jgi:hypothetical protein